MKLLTLTVDRFQAIEHAELELGPGLNVLYGPNDLGKSTLGTAIRAALLLPPTSSEAERYVPWTGDHVPRVELVLEEKDAVRWRIIKSFSPGPRGAATLERSRRGGAWEPVARGREVEEKIRAILAWGVPAPGGRGGPRGLPEPFLAHALVPTQTDVDRILRASLESDPDDSGKLKLTKALEAFAQDPRVKGALEAAQAEVDRVFTPSGRRKGGKDSPFVAAAEVTKKLQDELDVLERERERATQAELVVKRHAEELLALRADETEARAAVADVEARLALTRARAEAEAQLARAEDELRAIDAERAEVDLKRAALQRDKTAIEVLDAKHTAAGAEVERRAKALEEAKEAVRRATGSEAAARRAEQKSALVEEQAAKERALQGVREAAAAAKSVLAAEALLAKLDAEEREHAAKKEKARAKKAEQEKAIGESEGSRTRLRDLRAYARWHEAKAAEEKHERAEAAAAELAAKARDARAQADVLRGELAALALPDAEAVAALVALDRELQLAEAALGGGLSLAIRAEPGVGAKVVADGVPREVALPAGSVEAERTLTVSIPGVAELEIVAGQAAQRRAATALRARWEAEARPVLDLAGLSSLEALVRAQRDAEVKAREADRLEREASQAESQAATLRPDARQHAEAKARVAELERALEGKDRPALEKLFGQLGARWEDKLEQTDKRLEGELVKARAEVGALEVELARLESEASQRTAKRAEAEAANAASRAKLGGGATAGAEAAGAASGATAVAEAAGAASGAKLRGGATAGAEAAGAASGAEVRGADVGAELARTEVEVRALEARIEAIGRELAALETSSAEAGEAAKAAETFAARALEDAKTAKAAAEKALAEAKEALARAEGELTGAERRAAALPRDEKAAAAMSRRTALEALSPPTHPATDLDLEAAKATLRDLEARVRTKQIDLHTAEGALQEVGGITLTERATDLRRALERAKERQRELEIDADAWKLVLEALKESERAGVQHVGRVLADAVSQRFQHLTNHRYGSLDLTPNLTTEGIRVAGHLRPIDALSVGTRDQLATLLRLAIAESLETAILLDDHLVQTDPARLGWFLEALEKAAEKVQVVVLTCRPEDYRAVRSTELAAGTKKSSAKPEQVTWIDLQDRITRHQPAELQS